MVILKFSPCIFWRPPSLILLVKFVWPPSCDILQRKVNCYDPLPSSKTWTDLWNGWCKYILHSINWYYKNIFCQQTFWFPPPPLPRLPQPTVEKSWPLQNYHIPPSPTLDIFSTLPLKLGALYYNNRPRCTVGAGLPDVTPRSSLLLSKIKVFAV